MYGYFISLVRFIPRHIVVFGAIVNGMDSLIFFFSAASLLMYRSVTFFCMLILYPVSLLNMCISSINFFVESFLGFLYRLSCHSLLACHIAVEKSAARLMVLSLQVRGFSCFVAIKIFSLSLYFATLITICLDAGLYA